MDEKKRRVLDDDKLKESNNYNEKNDNFDDNNNNDEDTNSGFKISMLIYSFNIIAAIALVYFVFTRNIFPLNQRIIYTLGLLGLEVILYLIVKRDKAKFLKFISSIIMLAICVFTIGFIYYFSRFQNTIHNSNNRNSGEDPIESVDESKIGESFNVYISGLDVYGSLDKVSRSDVNIIATVNLETGKVLLTTVSRDAYLPIAGGGNNQYDKLTHAGNYGVQSSIDTLENFLDIDISYYARINFDSFIKLIDTLGGIEVYNDQEFKSRISDNYYPEGKISLDGEQALYFVRERYNLRDGDKDRARNQEKVITAMIEKMSSPAVLLKFDEILSVIDTSVNTNMSTNKMMEFVNRQLFNNTKFNVESTEVDGYSQRGLHSYAMPHSDLYMFVPYDESVKEIKMKINSVLEGDN